MITVLIVLGGWGAHSLYGTRVSATPEPALGGDGTLPAAVVKRGDVASNVSAKGELQGGNS